MTRTQVLSGQNPGMQETLPRLPFTLWPCGALQDVQNTINSSLSLADLPGPEDAALNVSSTCAGLVMGATLPQPDAWWVGGKSACCLAYVRAGTYVHACTGAGRPRGRLCVLT